MTPESGILPVLATFCAVAKATRISCGWTQRELSRRAGVPQSLISELERGIARDIRLSDLERIAVALGIRYRYAFEPPTIHPRQQRDFVHARCSSHLDRRLRGARCLVAREVEIGSDRSRGWIDILAFQPATRTALVIEIKTELHDIGAIERSTNWYGREAWAAARRAGWPPRRVIVALIVLQSEANDRAISANRDLLRTRWPGRATELASVIEGADPSHGGYLAMVDPRSHRTRWLRPVRSDGRRSPAPYVDYIDAARMFEGR